ncbi:tRNA methyltransferase complex GCD14 subunit-domain-containing protein [Phlyctochytrium arcticum]|nr:tRNA methyltransferase complex GCD14 subunit-domain-containing protein [Phlyctochytrium arcticum]
MTPIQKQTFGTYTQSIALGDVVIAYSSPKNITFFTVTDKLQFVNSYGAFPHNDMIGKPWGSKVGSKTGKGFIFLLHPTPELWTLALPHRTQILYHPDISYVTTLLDLRPGSTLIEAGTGSGSFSHACARTVAPGGRVFSFEYSLDRYQKASLEFTQHGLDNVITLQHRNVCTDGFGLDNQVDAIFLDLPAPWEALPSAKKAFKQTKAGRICCFSPCMEQVLTTCTQLQEQGFVEIKMFEVLSRSYDLRKVTKRSLPRLADRNKLQAPTPSAPSTTTPKRKSEEEEESTPTIDPVPALTPTSQTSKIAPPPTDMSEHVISKPVGEIRGHTSYLTFATLLPSVYPGSA